MKRFLSRLLIVLIVTAGGVSVYYWPEIRFYLQKETQQQTINDGEVFSQDIIIQKARELSKEAYKAPLEVLLAELKTSIMTSTATFVLCGKTVLGIIKGCRLRFSFFIWERFLIRR